jgi:uncharacterized protein with PIN domain
MAQVTVRLYGSLGDFVPEGRPGRPIDVSIDGHPAVKDTIESVGVPHVEVDLVLVDGISVGFDAPLSDGVRVAVYPRFFSIDIDGVSQVRVPEPDPPRFVLDVHLGALARHMRLLGIDTAWPRDADDPELAEISARERRILLTRDRGLLKRRRVDLGYCVRANDPETQIVEVASRFELLRQKAPFSRCLACNGRLERVEAESLRGLVPPRVLRVHQRFARCTDCQRPYWGGTHYERLQERVDALTRRVNAGREKR